MTDDTYSGWTNRETWALMLWINNDENLQDMAREFIRDAETAKSWTESMFTRSGYADTFGDKWPNALADIAEDIGSLWRINYYEVAESILEDVSELTA